MRNRSSAVFKKARNRPRPGSARRHVEDALEKVAQFRIEIEFCIDDEVSNPSLLDPAITEDIPEYGSEVLVHELRDPDVPRLVVVLRLPPTRRNQGLLPAFDARGDS
jgi:hypothetical protein